FSMGSSAEEFDRFRRETFPSDSAEGPQHLVHLTKGYYLGAYEVTQLQFFEVMEFNPSQRKESTEHPVESVLWREAMDFCKRLSARPEEKKAGRVYRLPTEAEWEHACRAGTTTPFYCGNFLGPRQANFNEGQGGKRTRKVGT